MPVDADEALRRATLIRSDPSLRGVTRRNIAEAEDDVLWEYLAPDGDPINEEDRVEQVASNELNRTRLRKEIKTMPRKARLMHDDVADSESEVNRPTRAPPNK